MELWYYREVAETVRTPQLPGAGYGPEPRSSSDVMMLASARVAAVLPSGWGSGLPRASAGRVVASTPCFGLFMMAG